MLTGHDSTSAAGAGAGAGAGVGQRVCAQPDQRELKSCLSRDIGWHTGNTHNGFVAHGVHGQTVYIDPQTQMLIVCVVLHLIASNNASEATLLSV